MIILGEWMKMSKAGVSLEDLKAKLMENDEFQKEYKQLKPRYEVVSQIIEARNKMKMTQAQLAKKIGTQKSNISRLESGNYNPSLDMLVKIANALEKEIKINLI